MICDDCRNKAASQCCIVYVKGAQRVELHSSYPEGKKLYLSARFLDPVWSGSHFSLCPHPAPTLREPDDYWNMPGSLTLSCVVTGYLCHLPGWLTPILWASVSLSLRSFPWSLNTLIGALLTCFSLSLFFLATWLAGSYFPYQGLNPRPSAVKLHRTKPLDHQGSPPLYMFQQHLLSPVLPSPYWMASVFSSAFLSDSAVSSLRHDALRLVAPPVLSTVPLTQLMLNIHLWNDREWKHSGFLSSGQKSQGLLLNLPDLQAGAWWSWPFIAPWRLGCSKQSISYSKNLRWGKDREMSLQSTEPL